VVGAGYNEFMDLSRHFLKRIAEYEGRWLRVVVDVRVEPERAVTAFFDRRLGRISHEDQRRQRE
jgi:hypothetical protein